MGGNIFQYEINVYIYTCTYIFTFRSTNIDGRGGFLTQSSFKQAVYKLHFDTGAYFKKNSTKGFYPYVEVRLFKKKYVFVLSFNEVSE